MSFTRKSAPFAALVLAVLGLAGCAVSGQFSETADLSAPRSTARVVISPAATENVQPGGPLTVTAHNGRLVSVVVRADDGTRVAGARNHTYTRWTSSPLSYGTAYEVRATAVDRNGVRTAIARHFVTQSPQELAGVGGVSPSSESTFGVGMPIIIDFAHSVTDRIAVEKRLKVSTPRPIEGAWRWTSDSQVEFRPRQYWPANIPIAVSVDLVGVQLAPGVWGEGAHTYTYRTTDAILGTVNMATDTLTVRRNGKVVRVIPVTTGKPGFETRTGIKVIMNKERTRLMDAATGGTATTDPNYYKILVEYAMRLTDSGEFLHAAPWSVGSQGKVNVSHGCTGMSTADAQWLYGISNEGDVYTYVGNSRVMGDDGNGITVWNRTWDSWLTDSATGSVMTTASATS